LNGEVCIVGIPIIFRATTLRDTKRNDFYDVYKNATEVHATTFTALPHYHYADG